MNLFLLFAAMLILSPENKADFDSVTAVPYTIDDEPAFRDLALKSKAVAFAKMPRPNILHAWKGLGVKVLQTVSADPEKSPEYFCREAGFLACARGADGIWIPEGTKGLNDEMQSALLQARRDWVELEYVTSLAEAACASEDGLVRTEGRRAKYYFYQPTLTPFAWENLDTLRLELTAWGRRLEQVLKRLEANLPTTAAPALKNYSKFRPFGGANVPRVDMGAKDTLADLGGGFSASWDKFRFHLRFETHKGSRLKDNGTMPGTVLDFRLYLPGKREGEWLPYRIHCDLNPMYEPGPRAPARGRGSFLFGTDERFKPFALAYAADNRRCWAVPQMRTFDPTCPDPDVAMRYTVNKDAGYTVDVTIDWWTLRDFWPMLRPNIADVWYVGLEKSPETGEPVRAKLVWPRVRKSAFDELDAGFTTAWLTRKYQLELTRTQEVWLGGQRDHYYTFIQTEKPTYNRGDFASDEMFRLNLFEPLRAKYAKTWEMCETTKDHPPTYLKQIAAVQKKAREMAVQMARLSFDTGLLRRDYLIARFAGKEPPKPRVQTKSQEEEQKTKGPALDDSSELSLDEEEI